MAKRSSSKYHKYAGKEKILGMWRKTVVVVVVLNTAPFKEPPTTTPRRTNTASG